MEGWGQTRWWGMGLDQRGFGTGCIGEGGLCQTGRDGGEVYSHIVSGLEAYPLSKAQCQTLDRTILKKVRFLRQGRTCNRSGAHMVSQSNHSLWGFTRLVPLQIELAARTMAADYLQKDGNTCAACKHVFSIV